MPKGIRNPGHCDIQGVIMSKRGLKLHGLTSEDSREGGLKELCLATLASLCIVLLSLFQTWEFFRQTPADRIYPLVNGYMPDYYWYLSLMRQGWDGSLLVTTRFTPEAFAPQLVNTLFPILGMTARALNIWLPAMYLVARIVFGMIALLAPYLLARRLFVGWRDRIIAMAMVFLSVPLWFREGNILRTYGDFWAGLDPIVRLSFLPHHLLANALVVVTFLLWSRYCQTRKAGALFGSIAAAAAAVWSNPASGGAILMAAGFASLLRGNSMRLGKLAGLALLVVAVAIPLGFLYRLQSTVFPWTAFRDWERYNMYPISPVALLGMLGPSSLFALIAVGHVLRTRAILWHLIVGWFLYPFIGTVILSKLLFVSNARFIQVAPHVPTAILGFLGVLVVVGYLRRLGIPLWVATTALVALFAIATVPSYMASVDQQMRSVRRDRGSLLMYVPKGVVEAVEWLDAHTTSDDIVVAPGWVSTIVPAFTSARTLLGHPTFTYGSAVKQKDIETFYGSSDTKSASDVLATYHATLVWRESIAPQLGERTLGLVNVFENPAATIYRVKASSDQ